MTWAETRVLIGPAKKVGSRFGGETAGTKLSGRQIREWHISGLDPYDFGTAVPNNLWSRVSLEGSPSLMDVSGGSSNHRGITFQGLCSSSGKISIVIKVSTAEE
jgi:hypothetical protein